MSSAPPLELDQDQRYEYLYLEEEEDVHSNTSDSDNDTSNLSEQNAQDFFYLIRHNKKKYIKERLNSSFPLKVNTTNNTRVTPIMSATIFRRHGILRILLARPEIRVNSQDEHQMTALLYAASNGDQRCLKYLLNAGANPAQYNTERRNLLHLLILRRHFNSVLYLLEYQDEKIRNSIHELINTPDSFGMTPLLYACEFGQRNLAKYLIQCGANYNLHDNVGRDALCHAIQSKSLPLVQFFLAEMRFDVNRIYQTNGYTPLFYAAMTDSPQLIMELLHFGAKIDVIDSTFGETPFLYACRHCKLDSIFALLFCGANSKAKNKVGTDALLYLVKHDVRDEMAYIYGVQTGTIQPISPFNAQGIYQSASRVELQTLYAHLRALADNEGYTSLIHAVLGDNSEAVKFLLNTVKCDIRTGDKQKRSALYHAVANRFVMLFELLIDAGADFNTMDQNKNTVLMHAVDSNNPAFVQSLIQRGANMTVLNHENWSALTYTCKTGNFELFRILIEEIRHRYPNPTETCALFTAEHLSLCLNVACVYGRPALGSSPTNLNIRQHAMIVCSIVARNKAVTSNLSGAELLRQCQFADPNMTFPGLEPSVLAAVRHSGDNTTILEYLFASPNAVNVRVRDEAGYTPTLLAVRLHCHNIIRAILSYEATKTQAIGVSTSQTAASAELRCNKDLTPADHACIIRHDKTFTEVRKRSRAIPQQKANAFKVSSGELLALGESFEGYLNNMYKIGLPYVEYISTGTAVTHVTPNLPITYATQENEFVLQEVDLVWLSEQAEAQSRQGYSVGTSLFELIIPEQSTYRPKVMVQGSVLVQPFIPREVLEEMEMYANFIKSASIVEQIIESPNTSRPARSADIPTYVVECKSLFFYAVVACKNLPLLLALLQCNFTNAGNAKPGDLGGFDNGAGGDDTPSEAGETGSQHTPSVASQAVSRPGMPPSRPGMPPSRPGMPPSRPGMPPSRPGMPPSRPGMPPSRPGMPTSPSTPATSTVASPTTRGAAHLRTDNIDNHNDTLLHVLFAFAGHGGASVSGTQFLLTAIICAKYSPFWDSQYIFVGHGGKYAEKRGKTIAQLAQDYEIPAALELANKSLYDIEQQAKMNRKKTGL